MRTTYVMSGGAAAASSDQFILSGNVKNPGTYTLSDLQAFVPSTGSVTYRSGQNTVTATFTGVPLWTLLTN